MRAWKPSPRTYYQNPIGRAGFHLYFAFNITDQNRCIGLVIEDDEDAYWELESQREAVEDQIGHSLEWNPPEETRGGNMRSELQLRADGSLTDREEWGDHIDWFVAYGERFHDTFYDRIQRL